MDDNRSGFPLFGAGLLTALLFGISGSAAGQEHQHGQPAPASGGMAEPAMSGMLGEYPMARESSGTSWQPEASPAAMRHLPLGEWSLGLQANVVLIYDDQGGKRGDSKTFATSMAMAMAQRPWAGGKLGLRGMVSLDPALIGKGGYPLLFQTGETADGVSPLVDRQHPHDLLMELAAVYSRPLGGGRSIFGYAALAGEPALGPPAFMHRFSGMVQPLAPLGHHWLDSTHIAYGVLTAGAVVGTFKLEASAFNGHEPDEDRYDLDLRALDSEALRISWNPSVQWALQASRGWLDSPEQLEPGVDLVRTTFSVMHHRRPALGEWQSTLAFGRNEKDEGPATEAWLLESSLELDGGRVVFGRLEWGEKDELLAEGDPAAGRVFRVTRLSLGYFHPLFDDRLGSWGLGVELAQNFMPDPLAELYGSDPRAAALFVRWDLR